MTAQPALRHGLSPEEYFAWEAEQPVRHEYYHGEVVAMSGGTASHALIGLNVGSELRAALRGRGCRVYSPDLRVQLAEGTHYAYPDVSVVCGEPAFADAGQTTLVNPALIVEVLSPATADYDRGAKFAAYRRLDSLHEYVLVAQDMPVIEVFRRGNDDRWTLYEPEDGRVPLAVGGGGVGLSVDAVFDGVDFSQVEPPKPPHGRA